MRLAFIALLLLASCAPAIERGDIVSVTYTGSFTNGTMFDTNDPAKGGSGMPFTVTVGRGQAIAGFEQALIGMEEGDTKTVTIPAADAYGTYDSSLVLAVPRYETLPLVVSIRRSISVPADEFRAAPEVGSVLETAHFNYSITGVNATHVSLLLLNPTKDPVTLEGMPWNSTLVGSNATALLYRHQPVAGAVYNTAEGPYRASVEESSILLTSAIEPDGQYSAGGRVGRVKEITSDRIYLDFNHPLAGQTLVFTITVDAVSSEG